MASSVFLWSYGYRMARDGDEVFILLSMLSEFFYKQIYDFYNLKITNKGGRSSKN